MWLLRLQLQFALVVRSRDPFLLISALDIFERARSLHGTKFGLKILIC